MIRFSFLLFIIFGGAVRVRANVGDDLLKITQRERELSFESLRYDLNRQTLKNEIHQIDLDLNENITLQVDQKKDFFSMLTGLTELRGGQWSQIFTKRKSLAHMELDLDVSKRAVKKAGGILAETRATAFIAEQKKEALEQKSRKLLELQKSLTSVQSQLAIETAHKRKIFKTLQDQKIVQVPLFFLAKGKLLSPLDHASGHGEGIGGGDQERFIESRAGATVHAIFDGKVEAIETIPPWNQVLIINHGDNYHTVYLNLKDVTIPVGGAVTAQTEIAHVAEYALTKKHGIFFEIRHFGLEEQTSDWLTE